MTESKDSIKSAGTTENMTQQGWRLNLEGRKKRVQRAAAGKQQAWEKRSTEHYLGREQIEYSSHQGAKEDGHVCRKTSQAWVDSEAEVRQDTGQGKLQEQVLLLWAGPSAQSSVWAWGPRQSQAWKGAFSSTQKGMLRTKNKGCKFKCSQGPD